MTVGVIAVWTRGAPVLRTFLLPVDNVLMIGRAAFPDDDRIDASHLEVGRWHHPGTIVISDRGSRTGTYVNGTRMIQASAVVEPPAIVRIGDTLLVVVADIDRYAGRHHEIRHGLDVCGSLFAVCNELDQAILDETNVAIAGPRWVTHLLGRGYLDARGGGPEIDIASRTRKLDAAIADGGTRCVLLESPNALVNTEYKTLRNWLETDVRFVTCMRRRRDLDAVPFEIRRWLAPTVLEIPEPRYDELPWVIHSAVRYAAPGIDIHAALVEEFLVAAYWEHTEDELFSRLSDFLRAGIGRRTSLAGGALGRLSRTGHPTFRMASYPIEDD
jgi:hypothetical protein